MKQASVNLLAGATFTDDEDRDIGRRDLGYGRIEGLHGFRATG